jgi:penicillin-binding protein 1A
MARAFSVFATGGYRTEPYLIQRIVDDRGEVVAQAKPVLAGDESLRVIDARNAFIMDSMMHDVVRYGTAARAMALGRRDLAGKTGTTNDYVDAWFSGYQATLASVAWVGFDQPKKLGQGETGSLAALPIWMSYMGKVLKDTPEMALRIPEGIVTAKVNENGLQSPDGRPEIFFRENVPPLQGPADPVQRTPEDVKNQLF